MTESISSSQFSSQSMSNSSGYGSITGTNHMSSATNMTSNIARVIGPSPMSSAGNVKSNSARVIGASHMSSAGNMNINIAPKASSAPAPKMSTVSTPKMSATPASTPTPKTPALSKPSTPPMTFAQMQAQSIEMDGNNTIGGTRRGEAPMVLPEQHTITNESITAIAAGNYKPGTLGHYQKQSVVSMQDVGRSPEFIISHLNQATAMKIPNYNLPADQAKKAFAMHGSGRTQDFIRGKLGLSASTPVPGKDAAKN